MNLPLLAMLALGLAGCSSSQTFEGYRLVEMPSLASAGVSILEVYEGGVIAERHVFSHNSVFSQIAGPAAVAYAGHAIGDGYKKGGDTTNVSVTEDEHHPHITTHGHSAGG